MLPRVATLSPRVLGSMAIPLARPLFMALSLLPGRMTFWRLRLRALDFHLGRRRMMLDRIAKVLPQWTAEVSGYASVLAMYAFALEENGQYRRAEKMARRALALDPGHPGAIHVVAHVMEMQGRFS